MSHFITQFHAVWNWLSVNQPKSNRIWAITFLSCGAIIAITPSSWRRTRLFATYVHETGHALVALLTGRRIVGIRLESDSSGSTVHSGNKDAVFSRFLTALAGYPAPAIFGWAMTLGITSGHGRWVVGAFIGVSLGLALLQHSLRGWAVTLLILCIGGALTLVGPSIVEDVLFIVAGYLLLASPRTIIELHRVHVADRGRNRGEIHSDAQALALQTGLGAVIWEAVFMLACLACLYYSIIRL